jgi:hypothetical protein
VRLSDWILEKSSAPSVQDRKVASEVARGMNRGQGALPCEVDGCKSMSQYECPKCAIAFCSVACYSAHSKLCVAEFKSNGNENLNGQWASDEERRKMRTVLEKFDLSDQYAAEELPYPARRQRSTTPAQSAGFAQCQESKDDARRHSGLAPDSGESNPTDHETSESDESHSSDGSNNSFEDVEDLLDELAARDEHGGAHHHTDEDAEKENELDIVDVLEEVLAGIKSAQLGAEEALARLPDELARDFKARIADGRIDVFMPQWNPWWFAQGEPDVDSENEADDEDRRALVPRLPGNDDFDVGPATARARAAPAVLYSVVEVVAAYCVVQRKYCGDWTSSPREAAESLLQLSAVLSDDSRYCSVNEAASCFVNRCCSDDMIARKGLEEASAVLRLDDGTMRAMFDAATLLRRAKCRANTASARKVGFFAAWVAATPPAEMRDVAVELQSWLNTDRS